MVLGSLLPADRSFPARPRYVSPILRLRQHRNPIRESNVLLGRRALHDLAARYRASREQLGFVGRLASVKRFRRAADRDQRRQPEVAAQANPNWFWPSHARVIGF